MFINSSGKVIIKGFSEGVTKDFLVEIDTTEMSQKMELTFRGRRLISAYKWIKFSSTEEEIKANFYNEDDRSEKERRLGAKLRLLMNEGIKIISVSTLD